MGTLEGKTVVVTGGASGIGAATVRRVSAEGARTVVVDRDGQAGPRIASEVGGVFYEVDLADRAAVRRIGARIAAECGDVHGLVNNAGISRPSSFAELDDANWDGQLEILLAAPAFLTQALLPALESGRASIVNVSSEGGFRPRADMQAYDAAKAGIAALARSLAAELGPRGIRVNSVAPGWIVSEMHVGTGADAAGRRQELLDRDYELAILGRLGRPEEIAASIVFLLSDDASYITGTCLHVDGGMGLG